MNNKASRNWIAIGASLLLFIAVAIYVFNNVAPVEEEKQLDSAPVVLMKHEFSSWSWDADHAMALIYRVCPETAPVFKMLVPVILKKKLWIY
jgi:hypothetical protein